MDDSGQIKLTHDAEDIKKMVERGMIKSTFSPSIPKNSVSPQGSARAEVNEPGQAVARMSSQNEKSPPLNRIAEEMPQSPRGLEVGSKTMTEFRTKQISQQALEPQRSLDRGSDLDIHEMQARS